MPLIKKIELNDGIVGLWEISEPLEYFSKLIEKLASDTRFQKITFEKRKIEFLAVRALLMELTGEFKEVKYKTDGAPFLAGDNHHISISHSKNLVAIIIHKNKAGIDVEITGRPVAKIANKFISEEEIDAIYKSKVPLNKLSGIQ